MSSILVYIEHDSSKSGSDALSKASLVAISAALAAKQAHNYSKVVGLVIGSEETKSVAEELSSYGLDEVRYVSTEHLKTYLALNFEPVVTAVAKEVEAKLVLAISSTRGKDLMPRVAEKLEAPQASDVISFEPEGRYKRPMFAGNIIATVSLDGLIKVLTIRGTAFPAAEQASQKAEVVEQQGDYTPSSKQKFVSFETVESERPELTEANVVVSGGRALKSSENFDKYLLPLADALGAAVGASRAAVDSGYAPNDWQVGQTGKVVAPDLYIAVGISGAIQHLAGMKDSKVIVAINKDEEAPIFEISDYGLVADLYDVLPQLTEEIKKAKS